MLQIEQKIKDAISETLISLGYNIVLIKYSSTINKTLQILLEKQDDSKINVEDCRIASNHISAILDVEDIISSKYHLEVSSAGVERPLITIADFSRFAGQTIIVRLKEPVGERKTFKGELLGVEGESVKLHDIASKEVVKLVFNNIKNSNILLTDELYRKLLNKAN